MSMLVNEFEWLIQLADESLSITLFPNNAKFLRAPLRTIEPLLNFCRRQKIFLEDVTYQ